MHRCLIKREGGHILGDWCALLIELIIKLMIKLDLKLLGELEIEQEAVKGSACFDELLKGGAEGHALHAWELIVRLGALKRADEVGLTAEVFTLLLMELIEQLAEGGVGHRDLVAVCVKGRGSRTAQGAA
jgi:hypothetical protein